MIRRQVIFHDFSWVFEYFCAIFQSFSKYTFNVKEAYIRPLTQVIPANFFNIRHPGRTEYTGGVPPLYRTTRRRKLFPYARSCNTWLPALFWIRCRAMPVLSSKDHPVSCNTSGRYWYTFLAYPLQTTNTRRIICSKIYLI